MMKYLFLLILIFSLNTLASEFNAGYKNSSYRFISKDSIYGGQIETSSLMNPELNFSYFFDKNKIDKTSYTRYFLNYNLLYLNFFQKVQLNDLKIGKEISLENKVKLKFSAGLQDRLFLLSEDSLFISKIKSLPYGMIGINYFMGDIEDYFFNFKTEVYSFPKINSRINEYSVNNGNDVMIGIDAKHYYKKTEYFKIKLEIIYQYHSTDFENNELLRNNFGIETNF